jgi:hypothetical protein
MSESLLIGRNDWSKLDDAALRAMYRDRLPVAAIAAALGRSDGAIRNRAYRLSITSHENDWTPEEESAVREAYQTAEFGEELGLDALALKLGRHKTNISRKARSLGLTDISRPLKREPKVRVPKIGQEGSEELRAHQSALAKDRIAKNGHPRGMLGKKHRAEARRVIGEKSAARWAALTADERLALCDKMYRASAKRGPPQIARGSWKAGWREIGGKRNYYRSRWEANYARWLQFLKERGEIVDWEHEPQTFWFEKIMRGVRSYKPDFRVTEREQITWHEVKGWMDSRSRTTLRRFAKYYPDEILYLVRLQPMKSLARNAGPMIEGWE